MNAKSGGQRRRLEASCDGAAIADIALAMTQIEPANLSGVDRLLALISGVAASATGPVKECLGRLLSCLEAMGKDAGADRGEQWHKACLIIEQAALAIEGTPRDELMADPRPLNGPNGCVTVTIPKDLDHDLLLEFVTECLEYIASAEAALVMLEKDPCNQELINTVFRAFHTIKGTSAFIELEFITSLSHLIETILMNVRDHREHYDCGCADMVLGALDVLKAALRSLRSVTPGQVLLLPDGYMPLIETLQNRNPGRSPAAGVAKPDRPAPATETCAAGMASPTPGGAATKPVSEAEQSIRVRTERLDRLTDMVGELVIAHTMVAQDRAVDALENHDLAKKIGHTGKIVRELQDLAISMRMVPLRATFQRMARLVRDLSRKNGKVLEFVTSGEDTEIDRNMVDVISDPLLHLLRNAIDHGIEQEDERQLKGKPRSGRVALRAYHAGSNVMIEVSDDGRGLDHRKIAEKAVERGVIPSTAGMTDQELDRLIFSPGFSTAERVTDVSGRGVGLDVVKRNVEALKGCVNVRTRPGKGTEFILQVPLTLAVTDGMLVRVGIEKYILPTASISVAIRPTRETLFTVADRGEMVRCQERLIPIFRLHRLFGIDGAVTEPTAATLIVFTNGQWPYAIQVDEIVGQLQIVEKSLGNGLGNIPGVAGGAILGDGHVGLILDPNELYESVRQSKHTQHYSEGQDQ